MIKRIIKKAKYAFYKQRRSESQEGKFYTEENKLVASLQDNVSKLKTTFGESHDLKIHDIVFGKNKQIKASLVYIDALADTKFITNSILRALLETHLDVENQEKLVENVKTKVLVNSDIAEVFVYEEIISSCLSGNTALLLDGQNKALIINTTGFEKRAITEPQSETVVRGPREGFNESAKVNVSLIRRKIKSEKLRVEHMVLGRKTKTDVLLLFLEGVVKKDILNVVKERLKGIEVDSILESGYIEQYIEDAPFSPFATVGYTEKPDVVAGKLLEGRVAIVVDGTPFVLTAPMLFIESFQTSEDYYSRPFQVSINRILRFMAYFISIFMPAIYIALTAYHQELVPTTLLITIANAREGTPFPVFFEALIMIFAFEVLREAGIRLPRPVGQAISIVGALIMGDAAVSAGLVGAPMVITIALTAVATFLVPSQTDSSTFLRLIMMVLASTLGFYGVLMGSIFLYTHITTLTSFGIPFFDGLGPSQDLQDSLIRMPLWFMKRRPKDLMGKDKIRHKFFIPPTDRGENKIEKEGGA